MIVPIFALANTGIALDRDLLSRALTSPVTLGIVLGSCSASRSASSRAHGSATRLSRGRLKPPVGWAAVAGGGTVAGSASRSRC